MPTSMHVAAVEFTLRLRDVRSLKQRRSVVRPITKGLPQRFPVAVAEVGDVESYRVATIGVTTVGNGVSWVSDVLDEVERTVWSLPDIDVLSAERTWMETDR